MPHFRDREKQRQTDIKKSGALFSAEARQPGHYGDKTYDFCLGGILEGENLYLGIRTQAIEYFHDRDIHWHEGERSDLPSRHLCCSQSMCVNALFPLRDEPTLLLRLLSDLNYPILEPLPFNPDEGASHEPGYVAFEWIGLRNYMSERSRGSIAPDLKRTRGAGFTSADFVFRFRRKDGHVQVVLGEWKYTECYAGKSVKCSKSGTDRTDIYKASLTSLDCPIKWSSLGIESLFFEPIDQIMRLQLLARAMERNTELGATVVSVLHVAPAANRELMLGVKSPNLMPLGRDLHEIWATLVDRERFKGVDSQKLLGILADNSRQREWAEYLRIRYGGMQ